MWILWTIFMSETHVSHTKPWSRMQSLSESRGGSKARKPIFSNSGKRYCLLTQTVFCFPSEFELPGFYCSHKLLNSSRRILHSQQKNLQSPMPNEQPASIKRTPSINPLLSGQKTRSPNLFPLHTITYIFSNFSHKGIKGVLNTLSSFCWSLYIWDSITCC